MTGKRYQFTLPEPLSEQLERVSAEKGLSKSVILAFALEQYLQSQNLNRKENVADEPK